MVPEAGQRFGPYEILGKLGGGGMGIVFRAWDERLHREVAIKLLHDEYTTPGMRERFLLEARAASALNHPNICTIFDIGEQDGEPYLVMEVLEGATLKQKISQGAVPIDDLVRISEEVSEALAAAHAKGIVHRDIKPANIFLVRKPGGKPQAKVLDFGLAKISQASRAGWASRALEITTAGSTVGTLAYMSPEQARGEPLDARSDLFSLGVVMYEMATRRVPFRGATSALVYVELLSKAPDSIRQWNDTVPKDLERLIFRLLSKDRSERFQNANELHAALRKLAVRGDGGWLKKVPRASVPLVEAPDPIARENRVKRKESDSFGSFADFRSGSSSEIDLDPESGGDLIRPRRLPTRESGPRESAYRSDREIPAQAPTEEQVSGEMLPSTSSKPSVEAKQEVEPRDEESAPVQMRQSAPDAAAEALETTARQSGEQPAGSAERAQLAERAEQAGARTAVVLPALNAAAATETSRSGEHRAEAPEEPEEPPAERRRTKPALIAAFALLAAGAVGVAVWMRGGGPGRIVLGPTDSVLLTSVQNRTGDPSLDGVVMEGLEIDLAQSSLPWRGQGAYRAGVRQIETTDHTEERSISAREAAQRLGSRAYVFGEVSGSGSPYTISLEVLETSSNDKLASLSATASGKREIAPAIDRLAADLRRGLGEDGTSIAQHSTPLAQQATGVVEALSAFAEAEDARQAGHLAPAIDLYGKALREAPAFSLAAVQLAWLEEGQYAELTAADAARRARLNAGQAGDRVRLLAQLTAEALDAQDYAAAGVTARRLLSQYPKDTMGMVALARVMRLQGHMTETLLSAEQAYRHEPTNGDAYREAGRAMLGLDRFADALKLTEAARQAGVADVSWRRAAAFLGGKERADQALGQSEESDLTARADQALALDSSGALSAGADAWRAAARVAQGSAGLASAGAAMLARGALNRALLGRCGQAMALAGEAAALPYGKGADFESGVAQALCGGTERAAATQARLERDAGPHSRTAEFSLPTLRGAVALSAKDPMRAQEALSGVHQMRDEPPLSLFLLGLAHLAAHHEELAIEDYASIDTHRGYAFVTGTVAYPMAEIELGRAEAARKQAAASAAAYRRFSELWTAADHADPLLSEASAKSH